MAIYETVIQSGRVMEIYRRETIRIPNEDRKAKLPRLPNESKTIESIQKANLVRAKENLWRLINCNFTEKDYFYTLTYQKKADSENADREITNFLRRLRRAWEKLVKPPQVLPPLKYIGVTESGEGDEIKRAHHHILLPGDMSPKEVRKVWGKGKVICSPLDSEENYKGLAEYIAKEFTIDSGHKKRWFQSRNLIRPTVTKKRIKKSTNKPIAAKKGYKIIAHDWASNEYGFREYVIAIKEYPQERKVKKRE